MIAARTVRRYFTVGESLETSERIILANQNKNVGARPGPTGKIDTHLAMDVDSSDAPAAPSGFFEEVSAEAEGVMQDMESPTAGVLSPTSSKRQRKEARRATAREAAMVDQQKADRQKSRDKMDVDAEAPADESVR